MRCCNQSWYIANFCKDLTMVAIGPSRVKVKVTVTKNKKMVSFVSSYNFIMFTLNTEFVWTKPYCKPD